MAAAEEAEPSATPSLLPGCPSCGSCCVEGAARKGAAGGGGPPAAAAAAGFCCPCRCLLPPPPLRRRSQPLRQLRPLLSAAAVSLCLKPRKKRRWRRMPVPPPFTCRAVESQEDGWHSLGEVGEGRWRGKEGRGAAMCRQRLVKTAAWRPRGPCPGLQLPILLRPGSCPPLTLLHIQ